MRSDSAGRRFASWWNYCTSSSTPPSPRSPSPAFPRFSTSLARSVRHNGVAADDRGPGGSLLFPVSGEELRGVEHRDQGFVLELLGEPLRFHRARDLGAHALHDRHGRARGRGHAEGAVDLQSRKSGLGERRHLGQLGSVLDDRERDQLGEGPRGHRRVNADHERRDDAPRNRHEVALRVVREVLVQARVDRDRGVRRDEKGVTVGRGLRRRLGADVAARAGAVVDDELLLERLGERLRELARIEIRAAARRRGHDEPDRPRRPGALRVRGRRQQRQENPNGRSETSLHDASSGGASLLSAPRFCEERGILNATRQSNLGGLIMQKAAGRLTQARGPGDPFEDHCWKDFIPPDVIELYSNYRREVGVGPSPALVAIDLYELVYQGGARPVAEVMKAYPNSCGEYAWAAIEPTRRLFAAARAAGPALV